jgi:hypothetical protein
VEESKKKSALGTNETIGNGTKPVLVHQIHEEDHNNVDVIRGKWL